MRKFLGCVALLFFFLSISPPAFAQMWAIRDLSRIYYGRTGDEPVPADYDFGGEMDVAVFRSYYGGLWAVRDVTRYRFGIGGDEPVPADYDGDLVDEIAIFRAVYGLWAVPGVTRAFLGQDGDLPVSSLGGGDFDGDGTSDIGIFRGSSGLWAIRDVTRLVFGGSADIPIPGDYDGDGTADLGIFREGGGLWAIKGITRFFFGGSDDIPVPGDYDGDGVSDIGIFRGVSGLWAIRDLTRVFLGLLDDQPLPGDYDGDGTDGMAIYRRMITPTPVATPTPSTIALIQQGLLSGTQTVSGIVNLVYPGMSFFIAEGPGAYHGIYISQSEYGPDIGDRVTLTGTVVNQNGKTKIQSLTAYTVDSKGNEPYAPVTISTSEITDEKYEGCLVKVEDSLTVTNKHSGSGKWVVTGSGNPVTIDDELDYNYFPYNGDQFDSIIGVVERNTSSSPNQWLQPRTTDDFRAPSDVIPHYALYGTVVTMDDSHNVYDSYYVEVQGESIAAVTASAPAGVDVIEVDGLIFPGLISTHDHLDYDLWDFIPFSIPPYFRERNDWADDVFGGSIYCDFKIQRTGFTDYFDQIILLTEARMASSGCTVTQSRGLGIDRSEDIFAKLGMGIINGERFPGRVYNKVLGVTASGMASEWAAYHQEAVKGKLHRYIIHLAETTDAGPTMAGQWNNWKSYDSFDGYDTIIHGMNIPAAEFALFDHGTDPFGNPLKTVLSWACKSNMLLYDATADIPGALGQGATVALAPDWTDSGMPNMLAELNYCKYVANSKAWNIQTRDYIDMVTRNAAMGFSQLGRMGTIEEGKLASFMVIDDGEDDPYDDLLMVAGGGASYDYRCGPKDVKLTVVAGRPVYGDASLLNTTNFPFIYHGYIEDLTICGVAKKLNFARWDNGAYEGVDELFWTYYLEMWEKYCRSSQYPCDFLPVDPAGVLPPPPPPTPSPPPGTYVINSSTDDACEHVSYYVDNTDYVYFGRHTVSEGYNSGFRFTGVDIPQGGTINSAKLVLTQYTDYNNKVPVLKIAAHDVDNSPTFSSSNGPFDRNGALTTTQVDWTPAAVSYDVEFQSPDISGVIQEVVNRPGWNSGNALSIILVPNEAAVDHRRRAWAYDGDPAKAARLEVDFVQGTPSPTPLGFKTPTPSPPPTAPPTAPPTSTPTPTVTPTPFGYETPSPTPTAVPGSNLLDNPGFESWVSSTDPESWTDGSYGDAIYAQEAGTVHGGSFSLKLTTTTDPGIYGDGIYQDVNVTVGEDYTFSAWLWSGYAGGMGVTASWWDGTSPAYWDTVQTTNAGEWGQWSIESTAPPDTISVRAWIRGFYGPADCGYADDAVFHLSP